MKSKIKKREKFIETVEKWLPGAGGNRERLVKGSKLSAINELKPEDLM